MLKNSTIKIIKDLLLRYKNLDYLELEQKLILAVALMKKCYKNNGKILVCGNGGSASDSEHIVGELMKSFILSRPIEKDMKEKLIKIFPEDANYLIENLEMPLEAISLVSQTSIQTAFSNDNAPDLIFAQQLLGYGKPEDILIAISTSGNSKNVIFASEIAKIKNLKIIALTGKSGGKLKNISDILINVPEEETFTIQEYHLPIYHTLCYATENEFFGKNE